ncbi:28568_t:CDS:10 [Dentiscutata erythropus]|uniref:28568_t:CDS:1 n=1 Tax=Dentiscutata erythropus TaxID=1348616 RepID=A0A9N9EML8_9GLOM|nr:28568_t:CDS:10 [Dentiscutata erythropus]
MATEKVSFLESQQSREIIELSQLLQETSDNVTTSPSGLPLSAKRPVIKKILEAMAAGIDVSSIFGNVVKAASTKDLVLKKLAYIYISTQAEQNADLVILAINTFQKDLHDENLFVRGLALRTLCSMRLSEYVPYMLESLNSALKDSSAYVRKTALISCIKVFHLSPEHVLDTTLIDQLYKTLGDRDPEVVANCVVALNEILHSQGGMTVNKKVALYLLQRIRDFNEWHQCLILNTLVRYKPNEDDEIYDIMNLLDDRLKHHNSGVQLAAMKLFIYLTINIPEIHEDLYKRVREPLLTLLSLGNPEIAYSCLEHLILLVKSAPQLFQSDYKQFYRRIKEPSFVTLKKLELFQEVATDINAKEIVDEISCYITSDNGAIANKSIQTISNIAIRIGSILTYSLEIFIKLLETGKDNIVSGIITILEDLLNESPDKFDGLLSVLPSIWASVDLTSPAGPAFLNLLMTVGNTLPETPYILESLIEDIENYPGTSFRLQLLNSSVALFLLRPAECKDMLAKLFKYTMKSTEHLEVRERSLFLYQLLRFDIETAKKIFDFRHETTKISNKNLWNTTKGRPLYEFNTLSITYGKPSEQFIVDTGPTFYWQSNQEIDSQFSPTLEFDTASEHNRDTFTLSSENPIDADANVFKSCWSKFINSDQLEISLPETSMLVKSLTLDDIEDVFKESNIFTMASGNTGDVLKFFLYSKEENSHVLILCELKINIHLASANINIKTGYLPQDEIGSDAQETELFKYSQHFSHYLTTCLQNLKNLISEKLSYLKNLTNNMVSNKEYQTYLDSERIYTCSKCHTHLAEHKELISKAFQGRLGRAYLFNAVENVCLGQKEDRTLITGVHTVKDISCIGCNTVIGWKYVSICLSRRSEVQRE